MCASKRPIIWLASEDWRSDAAQASYHITQELSRHTTVLYCDSIGIRTPTLSSNDITKALTKVAKFVRGPRRISSTLSVLTPFGFPASTAVWTSVNVRIVSDQLARAARHLGFRVADTVIWASFPGWAPIVRNLKVPSSQVILHFFDRWEEYGGVDRDKILSLRQQLLSHAGVVLASGRAIVDELSDSHPHVYLAPHGLRVGLFREDKTTPVPLDMQGIPSPIAGFFGTIDSFWIDFELLCDCAKTTSDISWVFVGTIGYLSASDRRTLTMLDALPNVHFLGAKEHSEIPNYGRVFDVGLLPFKQTALTKSAAPVKLPEYMALGLPVVSTVNQQYGSLRKYVQVAENGSKDFLDQVVAGLQQTPTDRQQRKSAVEQYDWSTMVRSYLEHASMAGLMLDYG